MRRWSASAWALASAAVQAAPWTFDAPIDVTTVQGSSIFHHLESAGRKNIAVSGDAVAVVWEDNRSGRPQVYAAFKALEAPAFSESVRVSAGREAFEPAVAGLGAGRFLFAWEQDGGIWVRAGGAHGLGAAVRISRAEAAQASVAAAGSKRGYAVWAERRGCFTRIRGARLDVEGPAPRIVVGARGRVDPAPGAADQLYPSAAFALGRLAVAWEDRRDGHTVLYYTSAAVDGAFGPPQVLNEQVPRMSAVYGKGTGVARVALAPYGPGVAAVWADKRDFRSGYDVYAAFMRAGSDRFGPNQKVQDEFGSAISQWHPAVAAQSGRVAVVWDDDRDESADIWLSWPRAEGWSDDLAVPGASGPGEQASPAVAMDARGNLHLVWIERAHINGPTRLRYALGRAVEK